MAVEFSRTALKEHKVDSRVGTTIRVQISSGNIVSRTRQF